MDAYAACMAKIDEELRSPSVEEKKYYRLSRKLWENPELKFEEKLAHDFLSQFLEDDGFRVTRNYILPTGFKAEYEANDGAEVTLAVICEYDALPGLGHACGHNLIAEAGVAAGIGIKDALRADPSLPGKIIVLGTPAEEGGNGKVEMIRKGAFDGVDAAMMVHPSNSDYLLPPFIGNVKGSATFLGKAAHASGFPWDGVNALDAAVIAYNSLACLRQHVKSTSRINAVITQGGSAPNVIPDQSRIEFYVRAAKWKELEELSVKVHKCFDSAAQCTGCRLVYKLVENHGPNNLISNGKMAEIYQSHATRFGVKFNDGDSRVVPFVASTDFGSVSHVVPSIHPNYSIGTSAPNHSTEFARAAGSWKAQPPTLIAAKSLALTAVQLMKQAELLAEIKIRFKNDLREDEK
ncbi:xaa-Arg dipeptidase-like [Centruroides vittatus]|uniref:xaa-Arg dipeptidase-like n=1 Tax=Centruroides vittatus TaxID=120091 RepID=UPI0035104689